MPPTGLHPLSELVIEIPDSYDHSRNNPNSVAIQQSTILKKQRKQARLMLFIIIMSGIVLFLLFIIWLCFMGFATTRVLVFIVTLLVFFFGTTWNNISGGIIFVILQHPFDIGDCCVVDNERMIVEKMGIWQTVFLRENNEKLYYTTATLLTKSIGNYNRSFEMKDILEILVDDSTSNENIAALKLKINEYVERNPKIWRPKPSFQIQGIEDIKVKYSLHISHAMNFQNYEEKNNQRSELVLELRKSFEQLGIKYFSVRVLTK